LQKDAKGREAAYNDLMDDEGMTDTSKENLKREYDRASLAAIAEEKNEGLDPAEID
jgi:hypothetical protein